MTDLERATPPSTAILRAIGYSEHTMMEIAMLIFPHGGQTELQGALLYAEVRRMVREGLLRASPALPLLVGVKTPRWRYGLTLLGLRALEVVDVDNIMIACEEPTKPKLSKPEV